MDDDQLHTSECLSSQSNVDNEISYENNNDILSSSGEDTGTGFGLDKKDTIDGSSVELSSIYHSAASQLIRKMQEMSVRPTVTTPVQGVSSNSSGSGVNTTASESSVSTPLHQVSPLSQQFRQTGSPSPNASHVSVGSVPPTLVAAVMPRHFDLTPVTRNTTTRDDDRFWVSPDTNHNNEDNLYGEHLALPCDLQDDDEYDLSGPPIPPLRVWDRAQSLGTLDFSTIKAAYQVRQHATQQAFYADDDDVEDGLVPPLATEFPSRRFYSFTSRQQYEQHHFDQNEISEPLPKPYQPSRTEDWSDIGHLPAEELNQIFISRRSINSSSNSSNSNVLGLQNPVPFEDRQFSIPSIRMAHHLHGSITTASYTDDDEESLLHVRYHNDEDGEDASLSSRASSLYLPEDNWGNNIEQLDNSRVNLTLAPHSSNRNSGSSSGVVILEETPASWFGTGSTDSESCGSATNRARKRKPREQRAMDWLQSVEADQTCVAEAASSKFLLSPNRKVATHQHNSNHNNNAAPLQPAPHQQAHNPFLRMRVPPNVDKDRAAALFRRQTSSPPQVDTSPKLGSLHMSPVTEM